MIENFGHCYFETINKDLIIPKVLSQLIREHVYKTLGTKNLAFVKEHSIEKGLKFEESISAKQIFVDIILTVI